MKYLPKNRIAVITTVFGLAIILAAAYHALAAPRGLGEVVSVKTAGDYVEVAFTNAKARISARGDGIIRVRATSRPEFSSFPSFAVVPGRDAERAPALDDREDSLVLNAGLIKLVIDKRTGAMDFLDSDGRALVSEPARGGVFFDGDAVGCVKKSPQNEHYYGFGEKTGPLDKRGQDMTMWTSDLPYLDDKDPLYQAHPFFMAIRDGRACGLFFDNTYRSRFDMAASDPDSYTFSAEDGELDYWVMAGPAPADVLARYGGLVGTMPLPPMWGLGNHQCRWSYKNEKWVREIRDGYQKHDMPLDAIYLDIHYMDGYRVFTFNDKRFPDPAGLFAELEEDGIKTVVIIDPGIKVSPGYGVYDEGLEKGYFAFTPEGETFMARVWPGDAHFPDFYRQEVKEWWGDQFRFYIERGVAGFWHDMNEPAGWKKDIRVLDYFVPTASVDWAKEMVHNTMNDPVGQDRLHNVYALMELEASYKGLTRLQPDTRPFLISRAGYPGIQRYALIWTGDNFALWTSLRVSVPMQLNMGMSGLAYVGSDVGGFALGPSKELFARWMQLGAFYPFSRIHTSANMPDQEPWRYGMKVANISRDALRLRYALLPYTYSLFERSTRDNSPVMRAMVYEFPDDERVSDMYDQFMWGPDLLVAPVMRNLQRKKSVYFPKGTWCDLDTGEEYTGPAEVDISAPLDKLPVFARKGAVIPMAPQMNSTGARPWDPLTVMVFPGEEESSFTLYEDDGKSFDYRKGVYARTTFTCRPVSGGMEIEVGARKGKFDPKRGTINVLVRNVGPDAEVRIIKGSGKESPAPAGSRQVSISDDGKGAIIRISEK